MLPHDARADDLRDERERLEKNEASRLLFWDAQLQFVFTSLRIVF